MAVSLANVSVLTMFWLGVKAGDGDDVTDAEDEFWPQNDPSWVIESLYQGHIVTFDVFNIMMNAQLLPRELEREKTFLLLVLYALSHKKLCSWGERKKFREIHV